MAYYAGHGRKPFSAAQLAAMEEERKKRLAIAQANQTALYKDDVGFWEGLLGKTSLEEQHQIMGNRYPDRGKDLRSWGD